jgi:hypothetical protein
MRIRRTAVLLITAFSLLVSATPARSQETGKPAGAGPSMEDAMKIMMQVATPGPQHKQFAELAGTWEASASMFMPGAPPQPPSKGSNINTAVLGGRYLQSEMHSTMMGMPFNGFGTMGYDNHNKKYFMFWVDDMGTGYSTAEGTADQSGKVITLYGKMDEPTTGENDKNVKYVYRIQSKDKYLFEIHDLSLPDGKTKMMEVTYTRK